MVEYIWAFFSFGLGIKGLDLPVARGLDLPLARGLDLPLARGLDLLVARGLDIRSRCLRFNFYFNSLKYLLVTSITFGASRMADNIVGIAISA